MATPPVTNHIVPDASAYLANIIADMHAHTVKVSYFFVGIIVLILGLAAGGGYLALRAYEGQVVRAEAQQAKYEASLKDFQTVLATHDAQRAAAEAKVSDLEAQIAHRATQPLPQPVQTGLKPDASAQEVKNALEAVYGSDKAFGSLPPIQGPNVALSVPQAQTIISTKVGLDRTQADLRDEIQIAGLQKTTIDTLQTDLNQCKQTVSDANKTIEAYKKAATKSRFRKFLDGAEKMLIFAGGAALGHAI